jgi:endonuclease/exonuclease/phosphatase family metal-dependent hydrolase
LIDADRVKTSVPEQIASKAGYGKNFYYGETLSMLANMQVKNKIMIQGLFQDWENWSQGNAVYSKFGFSRLSDPTIEGTPRNIPLYRPPVYEGTRDTDPRYAIITRVNYAPVFPYLVCLHLTTLLGERESRSRGSFKNSTLAHRKSGEQPDKSAEAQSLRYEQTKIVQDMLKSIIEKNEVIILMGDFNAEYEEKCISSVFLSNKPPFIRLIPENKNPRTHPKADGPIDHIFIFPGDRIVESKCWIEDEGIAKEASDHFPVVADIVLK